MGGQARWRLGREERGNAQVAPLQATLAVLNEQSASDHACEHLTEGSVTLEISNEQCTHSGTLSMPDANCMAQYCSTGGKQCGEGWPMPATTLVHSSDKAYQAV